MVKFIGQQRFPFLILLDSITPQTHENIPSNTTISFEKKSSDFISSTPFNLIPLAKNSNPLSNFKKASSKEPLFSRVTASDNKLNAFSRMVVLDEEGDEDGFELIRLR